MISQRASTLFILIFWIISMTWLGWTKLRPAAQQPRAPQHDDVLPLAAGKLPPIFWEITLNGTRIGWASHDVQRLADGQGRVQSTVRIDRLSVDDVMHQGWGGLGGLLARGLSGGASREAVVVRLLVTSSMQFDHFGQLQGFECLVSEDAWGECVRMQGAVRDDHLFVQAYLLMSGTDGEGRKEPVYQTKLPLPPDQIVVDSLAPRPRFGRLRVGQSWTFETYNPLRPTRPLQRVVASVVGRQTIRFGQRDERTYHVRYVEADDDGLSLERDLGELWVSASGAVLRQTMRWGKMVLAFERIERAADAPPDLHSAAPESTPARAPVRVPLTTTPETPSQVGVLQ
jgi:hypothetical protein